MRGVATLPRSERLAKRALSRALRQAASGKDLDDARYLEAQKPSFIIIGAAKCGTTSLAAMLDSHEEIAISRPKEPKFFGANYLMGWSWYSELFAKNKRKKIKGEASTMYASGHGNYKLAPALISQYVPNAKLIYITRHPIERTISHWRHWRGIISNYPGLGSVVRSQTILGASSNSFARWHRHQAGGASAAISSVLSFALASRRAWKQIVQPSQYYSRLQDYLRFFDRTQILLVLLEELVTDPKSQLARILRFLGATPDANRLLSNGQFLHRNPAGAGRRAKVPRPQLTEATMQILTGQLRPESEAFLKAAGKQPDFWRF